MMGYALCPSIACVCFRQKEEGCSIEEIKDTSPFFLFSSSLFSILFFFLFFNFALIHCSRLGVPSLSSFFITADLIPPQPRPFLFPLRSTSFSDSFCVPPFLFTPLSLLLSLSFPFPFFQLISLNPFLHLQDSSYSLSPFVSLFLTFSLSYSHVQLSFVWSPFFCLILRTLISSTHQLIRTNTTQWH